MIQVPNERPEGAGIGETRVADIAAAQLLRDALISLREPVPAWVALLAVGLTEEGPLGQMDLTQVARDLGSARPASFHPVRSPHLPMTTRLVNKMFPRTTRTIGYQLERAPTPPPPDAISVIHVERRYVDLDEVSDTEPAGRTGKTETGERTQP